jgi:hypothetical protein
MLVDGEVETKAAQLGQMTGVHIYRQDVKPSPTQRV